MIKDRLACGLWKAVVVVGGGGLLLILVAVQFYRAT